MENKNLSIYYLSSTHWDREWYQPFQGYRFRLAETTNEIIDTLENNSEFGVFHFDGQTIVLEDYLEIEPDKKERLAELIKTGKLLIGPWYVMPDEFLLSGESLIRNLLIGHKIASEWGVEAWKYGYVCDIFGHIAQMPQIFNGFDIKYALVGRGTNEHNITAHFIWRSPNGSECVTYKLPDRNGYGSFCIEVLGWMDKRYKDIQEIYPKMKDYIDYEKRRSDIPIVLVADGQDHEPIHNKTPKYIEMIKELYPEADTKQVNLVEMGTELEQYRHLLPVKSGELNETGKVKEGGFAFLLTHVLSSRYPIKKANDECQVLLEKWVEPLASIAELRGFSINRSFGDLAYRYLIQNHPHDSICGCSIDQVHKDMEFRFDQTREISNQIVDSIMNFERNQHTQAIDSEIIALLLWNPLPYSRKEVITVDIDFNKNYKTKYQEPFGYEEKNSFKIYDYKGKEIPYGIVAIKKNYNIRRYNQFVEKVDLYTISLEVEMPPMGTVEFKIVPYEKASRYLDSMGKSQQEVENEYIKLRVNDNGTLNIYDKVTNKNYDRLLSYIDDGELGDGWYHVNPAEDRVITSMGSECMIERVENGPSRTVFCVTNYMKVPAMMDYHAHGIRRSKDCVTLKICSLVGLSKGAKAVDIETNITNIAKDHRLRLKLPTGISSQKYFVNQPFAFVERKPGIDLDTQTWKECDVPEKQMGGIVGMRNSDKTGLAFVSAYGLHECAVLDDEQSTILMTLYRSFGKTVMTNGEVGGQIQGDLKFKYCITPIQPSTNYYDLIHMQDCMQAGYKAMAFNVPEDYVPPNPQSYVELLSGDVCMSIMKRPEKAVKNSIVIRLYNMSAEASPAKIRCFSEIKGVEEVNLNEEFCQALRFDSYIIDLEIKAWGIKTLKIEFI